MKKLILAVMLSVLLAGYGAAMAATSQIDNLPGGAGLSYWTAGGEILSLINIQNVSNATALCVHIVVYDVNGVNLMGWNVSLTPLDNYGVAITSGPSAGTVTLNDYSDMTTPFVNCSNPIPDLSAAGIPLAAPANSSGVSSGYVSIAITAWDPVPPFTDPIGTTGNLSGIKAVLPDAMFTRLAVLAPDWAFAMNPPMLQGFLNMGATINENGATDWIDSRLAANANTPCHWYKSGAAPSVYTSLDDANGVGIDFIELFASDNWTLLPAGFVCDQPGPSVTDRVVYPVLGSADNVYWGRFNENPANGTNTTLVLVAPASSVPMAAAGGYARNLTVGSLNDDAVQVTWGPATQPEVAYVPFGTAAGEINTGGALAGEAMITFTVPAFGFTFTTGASFADAYPLIRDNVNFTAINKTHHDRGAGVSDVITIP